MEIKDLKAKQGKVNMVVEIKEMGDVREFTKFGRTGRVCNAIVKDSTGETKLTLWNEDIDKVKVGDKVKIEGGFVNEFRGDLQLTKGKFGKLEVVEETGGEEAASAEEPKPAETESEQAPADTPTETPVQEEGIVEEKIE